MASHEYLKVEDVVQSLRELGGEAVWHKIQENIDNKRSHPYLPYKDKRNYDNSMFQLAQVHCREYAKFNGNEIFVKVSTTPLVFRLIGEPPNSGTIVRKKAKSESQEKELITNENWLDGVITSKDFSEPPLRVESKNYRIIRDTLMARKIKEIHNYQCQICYETPIKLRSGFYAEAHHIKPLGSPYNGPDVAGNIICVCPNCHVLLDYGAVKIDKAKILDMPSHKFSNEFIEFHNEVLFQKF